MAENDYAVNTSFGVTPAFQKLQVMFWSIYLILPMFTGWLAYDWLPNESYDEKRHTVLVAHEVTNKLGDDHEIPDMWMDKTTGRIYTPRDFSEHKWSEAKRLATVWFVYGLIGCFFFAYARTVKKQAGFHEAFGKAVLVNLAFAVGTLILIGR